MKPRALLAAIILTVLIAIPTMVSAAGIHYFDCDECHRDGAAWNSVSATGVCITCHDTAGGSYTFPRTRPDDGATAGVRPPGFSSGDASDSFGNNPAPGAQNSHNWGASGTNPAAGAASPSTAMYDSRRGASAGFVSCYKCHDPHAIYDASILGTNKMLRTKTIGDGTMANSEENVEAMCTECHLGWSSVTSAESGLLSHPMDVVDYEAFVATPALNQGRFKTFTPPAITADGNQMTLLAGNKIGCSSCHGIHNVDSGGANDGKLLKADPNATAAGAEICTSCHVYQAHAGTTALSCQACHSGHSYNDNNPNYYVLRSEVDVPAGVNIPMQGQLVTNLRYTSDSDPDGQYAAYCTGCHGALDNKGLNGISAGLEDHTTGHETCTLCHEHYDPLNPDKSFSVVAGGCTSCHGAPPNQNVALGPNGYADNGTVDYFNDGPFKDESATPHDTHATTNNPVMGKIACATCHSSTGTTHNDGNFQNVFDGATDAALLNTGGMIPGYTITGAGTCDTVYCHSNGTSTPVASDIDWESGNATLTGCANCHDDAGSGIGAQGGGQKNNTAAHVKHAARYSCNVCHDQTAIDGSTVDVAAGSHIDGTVQLSYDINYDLGAKLLGGGSANGDAGGCAVYCHSNGGSVSNPTVVQSTPVWATASTGACGTCHQVNSSGDTGAALGNAHTKHLFDVTGPQLACDVCHTNVGIGTEHVNGAPSMQPTLTAICNTCHGATVSGTGVDLEPGWTLASTVNCETCHSGAQAVINAATAPPVAEAAYDNGHGKGGIALACVDCHVATADSDHLGGAATLRLSAAGLPAYNAGDDRNFCNNCHGATSNNHSAIDGTVCKTCHTQHGENNGLDAMLMSTVAGNAVTGFTTQGVRASYVNADKTGICQTCHTAAAGVTFFNQSSDFAADDAAHNPGDACSDCHRHDSTPKAFAGIGNACNACHGFPPTSAAHELHAPDSLALPSPVEIGIDRSACAHCHDGADLYTYDTAADKASGTPGRINHNVGADNSARVAVLATTVGYTGTNCASACHSTTAGQAAVWTDPALTCTACHDGRKVDTPTISTASHAGHLAVAAIDCDDCHDSVPADTVHITGRLGATELLRLQDAADVVNDEAFLTSTNFSFDDVANTCSAVTCHSDGLTAATGNSPAWGTAGNCATCHLSDMTSGSHTVHLAESTDCANCHTGTVKDTTAPAQHSDGNIDVDATYATANAAIGSGTWTTCSAASCHDDGRAPTVTANWGTTVNNCAECHATQPATGSHTVHIADGATCGQCHTGTTEGTTAGAGHRDDNIDTTAALGYTADKAKGVAFTTCATASCHNDGRNSGLTGTWGTALNNCSECHATVPTTGGHTGHVGVSFAGAAIACADCHAGSVQGTTAPSATHRDGDVNAAGYPVQANGSAFTTCSTASCHQTGQAANDYKVTPAWDANTANCTQCHDASPTSGSHTKHIASVNACDDCHTVAAIKDTSYASAAHGDGNVDVATGGYTANKAYGAAEESCASISCHSDGLSGTPGGTPVWGTAAGCAACHLSDMVSGSHGPHLTDGAACGDCHTGAVKDTTAPVGHTDGDVDVAATYATANAAIGATSWTTCSAASCHDDGRAPNVTAAWGTTVNNCAECHAEIPATGSHATHVADAAVGCTDCHTGAVQATTAPSANHRDGNVNAGSGYPVQAIGSTFTNCTTASCHDDGRGSAVTADWGTIINNCAECHAEVPATGSHASHIADAAVSCTDCHTGAVQGSTAPTVGHRDNNIDVTAGSYPANKAEGTGFTNCSTATCHNDGRNSGLTVTWGTTLNNCSECHATQPGTGSHTTHLALYNCANCHTGVTEGTTAGAGHRDGDIDVDAATGLTTNKALSDPFVSCGTNLCHGSNSPVWGTNLSAYDQCTQCHGQLVAGPATDAQKAPGGAGVDTNGDLAATDAQVGAHQIHLNPTMSAVVACSACHTVPGTVTAAGHIDSALPAELTFSGLALGGLDGQAAVTPSGCATTYCHDGAALKNGGAWDNGTLAPTWTDTAFISAGQADCDNCHGYPPAGGHVANSDCSVCHFNVTGAADDSFVDVNLHVDGVVQAEGGDSCTDCHNADIDGALLGSHAAHADTATFIAGKTVSGGDYGGAGWYGTTYVSGQPVFGCGQCHPAAEGAGHPTAGLNIDIDPTGETPGAGNVKTMNGAQSTPSNTSRVSVTCASVYCHSDAAGIFKTTNNWYNDPLPTDGSECATCHGNSPTTNAHGVHEVGIHYAELYDDDGVGLMAVDPTGLGASGGSDSAHGNGATSTTISCYTCHSLTVTDSANALNSTCNGCHIDTNSIITGDEVARISTSSTKHINGVKDVAFADLSLFKSKAQLRDNLSDADDGINLLSAIWNRLIGYKPVAGTGADQIQGAYATPTFGGGTCSTVACHNDNTATWTDTGVDCMYCHTSLPK